MDLTREQQTEQFAQALLPESAPEGSAAALFLLPGAKTVWCSGSEDLARHARKADDSGLDVYVGVCLRNPKLVLGDKRGGAAACTHALGVGLDLDIGTEGHGGAKRRFGTVDGALKCMRGALSLPPTLIVFSGGGLHLWWLYREPFSLESPEDRRLADMVARGWNARLAEAARFMGADVDSTFDLARVLRVPGTANRKIPGRDRAVELLEASPSNRYDPSDLQDALGEEGMKAAERAAFRTSTSGSTGRLVLSADAQPPMEKMMALFENHDKFKLLWTRDPSCLKWLKDHSASAFDMALANIAVRAQWTDQEITDLLIAGRRKAGNDLKLRESYYAITIEKARAGLDGTRKAAKENAERVEEAQTEAIVEAASIADPNERRKEILLILLNATGVDVQRIISNGKDPAHWRIILASGEVAYASSTDALMERRTWLRIGLEAGSTIPAEPVSNKVWHRLVGQLAQIRELEVDDESLAELLSEYIRTGFDIEDPELKFQKSGALANGRPILYRDGRAGIHMASFSRWLLDSGRKTDSAALKARLRAMGFRAETIPFQLASSTTSRMYWIGYSSPATGEPLVSIEQGEQAAAHRGDEDGSEANVGDLEPERLN